MEKVKFTFEKSHDGGDKVVIRKDGGFTTADLSRLTTAVEAIFSDQEVNELIKSAQTVRAATATPPPAPKAKAPSVPASALRQGAVGGKMAPKQVVKSFAEIDGRKQRAEREPKDLVGEPFMARLTAGKEP